MQEGGLELVERLDQLWEGQGDRQAEDAMEADRHGGRALAADVGGGGAAEQGQPLAGRLGRSPAQLELRRIWAQVDRQPAGS
jgi:hypothetical protein